jgi:uncharacterized membrane protein (UPF0127 family)
MGETRQLVIDGAEDRVVCERCVVADRPHVRMRGLLGRVELPAGEGLLLRPAPSVHTWFMRFPIDAVFLDGSLRVLSVSSDLGPWRFAGRRGARAVLELAAGEAERRGLRVGVALRLADRDGPATTGILEGDRP